MRRPSVSLRRNEQLFADLEVVPVLAGVCVHYLLYGDLEVATAQFGHNFWKRIAIADGVLVAILRIFGLAGRLCVIGFWRGLAGGLRGPRSDGGTGRLGDKILQVCF